MSSLHKPLAVAAVLAAVGLTTAADAQVAVPAPGCAGLAAQDVPGDQTRSSPFGGPTVEGPTYLDLEGLFFTYVNGKTFANVQVADLTDEPDPGTATRWYVQFQNGSKHQFVRAAISATGDLTYGYGDYDPVEEGYTVTDETAGQMFLGEHGIISIQVPSVVGGKAGNRLVNPFAITYEAYYAGATNVLAPASDRAPDEADGTTYDVAACETGSATPTPDAGATPTPTPAPSGGGTSGGTQSESVVQRGALDVRLAGRLVTARKASMRRSLPVGLRSGGTVKDITATLYDKRKKAVGKGRLATLSKKGTIKLKVRKLKKGSYTLALLGTNSDGRKADRALKLRLR